MTLLLGSILLYAIVRYLGLGFVVDVVWGAVWP